MRYKLYAIIHLVILILYLSRPIMPYIEYAVFKDYIVKNLCINRNNPKSKCNGKCHLAKQLRLSNETSDAKGENSNKKVPNQEVKEFLNAHVSIPKAFEIYIDYPINKEINKPSNIVLAVFVPPEKESFI
jgi:hypothetical protein